MMPAQGLSIRARVCRTAVALFAGVLSTLGIAGCGGSGGGPTSSSGSKGRTVIAQQGWAADVLQTVALDVKITGTGTGTLDATVEWTFASNDVDLYVTATACTPAAFANLSCAYKAKSDSQTAKPERVSFSVSGPGDYRFWIANFGPTGESGTIDVGLTQ